MQTQSRITMVVMANRSQREKKIVQVYIPKANVLINQGLDSQVSSTSSLLLGAE